MKENRPSLNTGVFSAIVSGNRQIGHSFYVLGLEFSKAGAEAFGNCKPGQFAELDLSEVALPAAARIPENLRDSARRSILLRRPFSFSDVFSKAGKTFVEILFCALGPASLRMTTLAKGESISVIGPLGNGFWVPEGKKTAVLVAGGMGAGPLLYLAKVLAADYPEMEVIALAGAKTKAELPFEKLLDEISQQLGFSLKEFGKYGIESLVATEDGSAGHQGLVTDCLSEWLGRSRLAAKDMIIYSCGPEAMLAKVAQIAEGRKIDCQVSMERMMACGIGLCQSCAVECRVANSSETVYKLCCDDGPVFDSREVAF